MRDTKQSDVRKLLANALLNDGIGFWVHATSGLVQQQNMRVLDQCTAKSDYSDNGPLALANIAPSFQMLVPN